MTIYLDGNAIAPNNVKNVLTNVHSLANCSDSPDPYYDLRYTLRFNDIDHSVDAHGIIRDRGRFYGEHWIIVNTWYTVQDGTWGEIVYDDCDRAVTVVKLEPWEAMTINGVEHLIIGLYLTDDGFLGWYYTEDTNETVDSFAASIQSTTDDSEE
jgi:hypothetical protein